MSLEELRKKIDDVDGRIVRLIAKRIKIARDIGELKKKQGKQIEDPDREKAVFENVSGIAEEMNLSREDIIDIYRRIIDMSKSIERTTWRE
jgi:chorismate mutase